MQFGLAHAASHDNAPCLAACAVEQVVQEHLVAAQPMIVLGDPIVDLPASRRQLGPGTRRRPGQT
jgi:hypothetical protein